jgi:hypothetical protein
MARLTRTPKTKPAPALRIYCMGPGFGESIVLHLPCGGWGVVDSYHGAKGGTVDFLRELGVGRLKFFCLTHPHDDHYRGAHRIFSEYSGRIERLWRFPGLTVDYLKRLAAATRARDRFMGDPEAGPIAADYLRTVQCFVQERDKLDSDRYRQVIAPAVLLQDENYKIEAKGPDTRCIEDFQARFAKILVKSAPLLLNDEGGQLINSISVVLAISFGDAQIWLLGDAQGAHLFLSGDSAATYAAVKIAHHGSSNGFAAGTFTSDPKRRSIDHAIVTPYVRSGLPNPQMKARYTNACTRLVQTRQAPSRSPRQFIPTMNRARVLSESVIWSGVEVFATGKTVQFR